MKLPKASTNLVSTTNQTTGNPREHYLCFSASIAWKKVDLAEHLLTQLWIIPGLIHYGHETIKLMVYLKIRCYLIKQEAFHFERYLVLCL